MSAESPRKGPRISGTVVRPQPVRWVFGIGNSQIGEIETILDSSNVICVVWRRL